MKLRIQFKDPDAIYEMVNAKHPLPADADETMPLAEMRRVEKQRDEFRAQFFQYSDYGMVEIDTDTLAARLLPRAEWGSH